MFGNKYDKNSPTNYENENVQVSFYLKKSFLQLKRNEVGEYKYDSTDNEKVYGKR